MIRVPASSEASSGKDAASCGRRLCSVGPYLLIELLLPGGTLVAAAVYLLGRRCGRPV